MNKKIYVFQYTPSDKSNDEIVTLKFEIPEYSNIYDFHRLCKRFAAAVGYQDTNIEEVFGETIYNM